MIDALEKVNNDYRVGTKSRLTRERLFWPIIDILREKNGITASMIAERVGVSKRLINSILYKMEEYGICKKDNKYIWSLV